MKSDGLAGRRTLSPLSHKRLESKYYRLKFEIVDAENVLRIPAGLERVVETDHRILRVNGFDPKILHVTAVSPRQLLCRGDASGTTELTITDETQQTFRVTVKVTAGNPAKADQAPLTPFRPQTDDE